MDAEMKQLLMEIGQILAQMKVTSQSLLEQYRESKQSETKMEESTEALPSESSIAVQETKMEVSIEDESQSEMKVTTQALQEKFHESKKSETKNESIEETYQESKESEDKNELEHLPSESSIEEQEVKMELEKCQEMKKSEDKHESDDPYSDSAIAEREIEGAKLTRPFLYGGDQVVIHEDQGFFSHFSHYSNSSTSFSPHKAFKNGGEASTLHLLPYLHFLPYNQTSAITLINYSKTPRICRLIDLHPEKWNLNPFEYWIEGTLFVEPSVTLSTLSNFSFSLPSFISDKSSFSLLQFLFLKHPVLDILSEQWSLPPFEYWMEGNLKPRILVGASQWNKRKNAYKVFNGMTQRASQYVSSPIPLRDPDDRLSSLLLDSFKKRRSFLLLDLDKSLKVDEIGNLGIGDDAIVRFIPKVNLPMWNLFLINECKGFICLMSAGSWSPFVICNLLPSLNFLSVTGDYAEGEMLTASYGYVIGEFLEMNAFVSRVVIFCFDPGGTFLVIASNLLFVESPAGVGWSYSNTSSDYNTGDAASAEDMLIFLVIWLVKFPEFKSRDLFLNGENYAGHYIPQLAVAVLDHDAYSRTPKLNLQGVAIGNPLLKLDRDVPVTYEYFLME